MSGYKRAGIIVMTNEHNQAVGYRVQIEDDELSSPYEAYCLGMNADDAALAALVQYTPGDEWIAEQLFHHGDALWISPLCSQCAERDVVGYAPGGFTCTDCAEGKQLVNLEEMSQSLEMTIEQLTHQEVQRGFEVHRALRHKLDQVLECDLAALNDPMRSDEWLESYAGDSRGERVLYHLIVTGDLMDHPQSVGVLAREHEEWLEALHGVFSGPMEEMAHRIETVQSLM